MTMCLGIKTVASTSEPSNNKLIIDTSCCLYTDFVQPFPTTLEISSWLACHACYSFNGLRLDPHLKDINTRRKMIRENRSVEQTRTASRLFTDFWFRTEDSSSRGKPGGLPILGNSCFKATISGFPCQHGGGMSIV